MFGRRSDGTPVKGLGVVEKAGPHFMMARNDATNYATHPLRCEGMDKWIAEQREQGKTYSYMDIMVASIVRLLAVRPMLNRFCVRGKLFDRKGIFISMTVKKSLKDTANDTIVKVKFDGTETIDEVKEKFNAEIKKAFDEETKAESEGKKFTAMPNWLLRWAMGLVRWLDNRGMLPKKLIAASPFHTSAYLTNLKSIKNDAIYHHLFNFGTTTLFVAMGKEKDTPVVENGKLAIGKVMNLGITMDERPCDGFYFVRSLKIWNDLLTNPETLTKPFTLDDIILK